MFSKIGWPLRAGWIIVVAVALAFMAIAINTALNPLSLEEAFAGTTIAELQAASPQLANVVRHLYVSIGVLFFGANLLVVFLVWQGLARGSRLAWTSLLILGVTFLALFLLAHLPIGHTESRHFWLPTTLAVVYLVGLGLAAKPVLSAGGEGSAP